MEQMNKKLLVLIATIVLFVLMGGVMVFINSNRENKNNHNTSDQGNISNEESIKENETSTSKDFGKVLIVYYSWSGNTRTVANYIHEIVGGDIIELEPKEAYTRDMNELSGIALNEKRKNARPALKTVINDMEDYDTIFIGYPNWWSDMPMLMYTFLDEYDLSGKTIAPFVTHGESGLSGTPSKIQKEEPKAIVTEGLAVQHDNIDNSKSSVKQWISKIGF